MGDITYDSEYDLIKASIDSQGRSSSIPAFNHISLNNARYISLQTPTSATDRWKLESQISEFFNKAAAGGISVGLDLAEMAGVPPAQSNAIADKVWNSQAAFQSALFNNGAQMEVRGFITQFPNLGFSNQYDRANLFGGVLNNAIDTVTQIATLRAGATPNLSIQFQLPNAWNGGRQDDLSISFVINPFTLSQKGGQHSYLGLPNANYSSSDVSGVNGIETMLGVMLCLAMSSPRVLLGEQKGNPILNTFIKSPPVVDVYLGKMYFPSMNVTRCQIQFPPPNDALYDQNGFPIEAHVTMEFKYPLTWTQDSYLKMFAAIAQANNALENTNKVTLEGPKVWYLENQGGRA